MLRFAHEGAGQGSWSDDTDAVPVTEKGQLLSSLKGRTNPEHKTLGTDDAHGGTEGRVLIEDETAGKRDVSATVRPVS